MLVAQEHVSLHKVVSELVLYSSILELEVEERVGDMREVNLSPLWCRTGLIWLKG